MALKDWKKVGKNGWVRKSGGKRTPILEIKNDSNGWHLRIDKTGTIYTLSHDVKTKSAALKYAKSYMRKN